jgi:hypothetical protein
MARFRNKTPVTGLQHPKHLGDSAIVIGQHRKNALSVDSAGAPETLVRPVESVHWVIALLATLWVDATAFDGMISIT